MDFTLNAGVYLPSDSCLRTLEQTLATSAFMLPKRLVLGEGGGRGGRSTTVEFDILRSESGFRNRALFSQLGFGLHPKPEASEETVSSRL